MAEDIKPPISGYSIWYMLSEDDQVKLQQLIDKLSQIAGSCRFDAHATLIGLLDYKGDRKQLVNGISTLARSSSPITAEVTGVGMRSAYFQSVFLPVVPSKPLLELNRAACTFFDQEKDSPFMPHISMAYGDFDWQIKQNMLEHIVAKVSFPQMVVFDRLALVRVDGYPDEWVIEEESPFT